MHGLSSPDITFHAFYHQEVIRFIQGGSQDLSQKELDRTFVGSTKEEIDLVDQNLRAMSIISVFGLYTKFLNQEIGGRECNNMSGECIYDCRAHVQ